MDTPKIIAAYDNGAEEYAKTQAAKSPGPPFEAFCKLLKPGAKVLDIGCAAGRDTHSLKQAGFEAVGVDLSKNLLAIAKRDHPDITFLEADMRHLPFDDGTFDGIWALAAFHHLEKSDMLPTLKEWRRVLKPGGVLFLSTKMGSGLLKTQEAMVSNQAREFTLLSKEELHDLLNQAGFAKHWLRTEESGSRKGLFWLYALYRKAE